MPNNTTAMLQYFIEELNLNVKGCYWLPYNNYMSNLNPNLARKLIRENYNTPQNITVPS